MKWLLEWSIFVVGIRANFLRTNQVMGSSPGEASFLSQFVPRKLEAISSYFVSKFALTWVLTRVWSAEPRSRAQACTAEGGPDPLLQYVTRVGSSS